MRALVVVASRHGGTQEIGERIVESMRENGVEVDLADASVEPDPAGYDIVVVGSAVYFGRWRKSARLFVEHHREALLRRSVWAFSSGPVDTRPLPANERGMPVFLQSVSPVEHVVFGGRLDIGALAPPERLMMRVIGARSVDYRDWDRIESWARSIGSAVR